MAADTATSPSKAALEAAVLDLTDEQIVRALARADSEVARAFKQRESETWAKEATNNLMAALAQRVERGRVRPK